MYKEIFPDRLKKARIDAGYTQEQVSNELSITKATISRYETGKLEPNIEMLGKLAEFYAVPIDWLLGIGQKEPTTSNPPPKPRANIITKAEVGVSLAGFMLSLSPEDLKLYISNAMSINQFTSCDYYRKLTPEGKSYLLQEHEYQQWIKEQEEDRHRQENPQPLLNT